MNEWYDRIVNQVRSTPPECLRGFRTAAVKNMGPWEENIGWQLTCECGAKQGKILGYSLKEYSSDYLGPEIFVGPLAFQCSSCGKTTEIIDTDLHGYDAEIGKLEGKQFSVTIRGQGKRKSFPCLNCQATSFGVTVCFFHNNFDIIEDEPDLEPRSQDFFDAFDCLGVCVACSEESRIANFELA
jgi:hypothetical protein